MGSAFFGIVFSIMVALQNMPVVFAAATTTSATAVSSSSLQAEIDANNQQIADLNQQIANYQAQLQQIGADKKTLQQAINTLDLQRNKVEAQVAATEHQINVTQLQIQQLGGEITDAQATIATDQVAVGEELRSLQKVDAEPLFMKILSSTNLVQTWSDVTATLQVQDAIQNSIQKLQTEEGSLANSQAVSKQEQQTLTSQKQSLASQQQSLVSTEQSKSQLLSETNAKESNYEKLLAAAEAELKSFSTFVTNAGGSKLLTDQTSCDAWGCYYNQRDALWGNVGLDGTQFTLASEGCLVTSMAMVLTHYGYRDVTPLTINDNPDNFAAYYPSYLLYTVSFDGMTATRKAAAIDATLATGNPVIVGLNAYGGTHYVVFVSGKKGNYLMRDPYIVDGKDVSFSANYSMRDIFAAAKIVING
jgi:peptidoglycan hydrolase CwlO-like protein